MMGTIENLVVRLAEESFGDEDDFETSLGKDLTDTSIEEVEATLSNRGFEKLHGVWVMNYESQEEHDAIAKKAVTVSLGEDECTISCYRKVHASGKDYWVFTHSWCCSLNRVLDYANRFNLKEDIDDEDLDRSDLKDVAGETRYQEILALIDSGVLSLGGSVTRNTHHYVHENTTSCSIYETWSWEDSSTEEQLENQKIVETRVNVSIDELERDVNEDIRRWNKKIYREIEAAYEDYISDENVAENIKANEYTFNEDGNRENDGIPYNQLTPEAQSRARYWWREALDQPDWEYMSEPVIAEWKWLLKNKGFREVEIAWSGFGSQGDGASFTAKYIDFKAYITGPDPIEFPEQQRERLWENEDEEFDPRDVYDVNRKSIKDIRTKSDYAEYQARFQEFLQSEGIQNLSPVADKDDGTPYEQAFSHSRCPACDRPLAGNRIHVSGYDPKTKAIKIYWVCSDCVYYAEYGQLDDMTMMNLKNDLPESEDESDDMKEILGEPEPRQFFVMSSHGHFFVDTDTGNVIKCNLDNPNDPEAAVLKNIVRFDIAEYLKFYPERKISRNCTIDILDLGYWLEDGTYEPPLMEWRNEIVDRNRGEQMRADRDG